MLHSPDYGSIPATDGGSITTVSNLQLNDRPSRAKVLLGSVIALSSLAYGGYYRLRDQKAAFHSYDYEVKGATKMLGSPAKHYLIDDYLDQTPLWHDQYVDHIGVNTELAGASLDTYRQRFMKKSVHWKGPGHPILVILGGEGPLEPPMLYQFVHDGLAEEFGAFVLSPEHRFYGESRPIRHPTVKDLVKYLTPDQALADAVNLIQYVSEELGCSTDRSSSKYCPVITFGGSYPGFLSAMLRFRYPDYVDIGYASSAPLDLYSQVVNSDAYYDKVTAVADIASPGCADAVRSTLFAVQDELLANYTSVPEAASASGFCRKTFPKYIKDVPQFISEAIVYLVPAIFADFNMAFYPPGPDTELGMACAVFQDSSKSPLQRLSNFFSLRGEVEYYAPPGKCFDVTLEIPDGPHARIRGADNSGTGGGAAGEMWEFQCCKDLIIRAGYSEQSMFIPDRFSYDWRKQHCKERFPGVTVDPFRMAEEWEFNDLSRTSRLLFANGLNDGWSTSSILKTDNPHIAIVNFPNGAHHSELRRYYPDPEDTPDVKEGHELVKKILGDWLNEIYEQRAH